MWEVLVLTRLIRIGNSLGVRIPKAVVEQARLKDHELELRPVAEGLLIAPIRQPRQGWKEAFEFMHESGDDKPLLDGLVNQFDEEEWEW